MAFTTSVRLKDLINQSGSSTHFAPDADAITNAVDAANGELEQMGVTSTERDAGLLGAADRLALAYLAEGLAFEAALRRESLPGVGMLREFAIDVRKGALETANLYVSRSLRNTTAAVNRNWAYSRGGALRVGSEAGSYKRSTR